MKKINKKGFTLVELLLVIAIIGILAAVLFVSLNGQRERARKTAFKETMRGLVPAATACADSNFTIGHTMGGVICSGGSGSASNIPSMSDCDGEETTNSVAFDANPDSGDNWHLVATCHTSIGDCDADCTAEGCTFSAECE